MLLLKQTSLCKMSKQEYFTTSTKIRSITQNVSTLQSENRQDSSLTSDPTFSHSPPVNFLGMLLQKPHLHPTRGSWGTSLQPRKPWNFRPWGKHRTYSPTRGNQGTSFPGRKSSTIHPIRKPGTSPPNMGNGGKSFPQANPPQAGDQGPPIRKPRTSPQRRNPPPRNPPRGNGEIKHNSPNWETRDLLLPREEIKHNPPNRETRDLPPQQGEWGDLLPKEGN